MVTIPGTKESYTLAEAQIVVHEPKFEGGGTVTLRGVVKSPDGTKAKWFAVELDARSMAFALDHLRKAGLQDSDLESEATEG